MVTGIDKFREHFAAYEGQYAIIGGTACDLLFDAAGVSISGRPGTSTWCSASEAVDAEFGTAFQTFLDAGGYKARERSDGQREFYRFHHPTDRSFPFMIELFARRPVNFDLPEGADLHAGTGRPGRRQPFGNPAGRCLFRSAPGSQAPRLTASRSSTRPCSYPSRPAQF